MRHNLRAAFAEYFLKPVSPYPLGLFRIMFALCVCATLLLLHSDWIAWFGVRGWVSMQTIGKAESGFRLGLFAIIPHDDRWIALLFWLLVAASITLTSGLGTRLSSIIVYLGLNSLNQRNPLILHGGDTFLRAAGFFLMFAPAGAALSLDSMLRNRRRHTPYAPPPQISPWVQRLIQYQLAIIYLAGFWWKAKGVSWWNGTALYYVVHLGEIRRFPIPGSFYAAWVLHLGTWLAMAFELLRITKSRKHSQGGGAGGGKEAVTKLSGRTADHRRCRFSFTCRKLTWRCGYIPLPVEIFHYL
jgi:hypothetical protein